MGVKGQSPWAHIGDLNSAAGVSPTRPPSTAGGTAETAPLPAQGGEKPSSPGTWPSDIFFLYVKILCIFYEFLVMGLDELKSERTRKSEQSLCPRLRLSPRGPLLLGGTGEDTPAGTGHLVHTLALHAEGT